MRKVTWSAEFSRLVTELANDDVIQIKDVSPGPVITCFTLVVTSTLQYLKELKDVGALRAEPVLLTDCTFNLEWMGYTFANCGYVAKRCIQGKWRTSYIPILLRCCPRERKAR